MTNEEKVARSVRVEAEVATTFFFFLNCGSKVKMICSQ